MRKKPGRIIALLLSLCLILTGLPAMTVFADPAGDEQAEETTVTEAAETEDLDPSTLHVAKLGEISEDEETELPDLKPDTSLKELVRVSVFLEEPSAVDAGYSTQGIGTNSSASGYRASILAKQRSMQTAIESKVGYPLDVVWNLTLLTNAFSTWVYEKDIPIIERMSGVKAVQRENLYTVDDAAQPNTAISSNYMAGATDTWSAGYTGAGTRIAIIDTGIDLDHISFDPGAFESAIDQVEEEKQAPVDLMGPDDIPEDLNGEGIYHSSKIPYIYNYVDENTDVTHINDTRGEHGSHVAGIAAANRYIMDGDGYIDAADAVKAVGMAPDAQLLVMKVFGRNGGAYDSDYFAAVEDAVALGADAVNLSLGSGAPGFTYANYYQEVLNGLAGSSVVAAISAGNAGAMTDYMQTDLFIDDVSMHTGGSPGTYINSLCVAAADNLGMTGTPLYFNDNGRKVFYTESTSSGGVFTDIGGNYEFVYIDGTGTEEDYSTVNEAVGLEGKVVIVNRGVITFVEKGNNAIPYNPAGLIVANNQSGTIGMSLDDYTGSFPMVSITLADAEAIIDDPATVENEAGSVTYYTGTVEVTSVVSMGVDTERSEAHMSDFSSWGVPGSLLMKPEITAPGGNIYSVAGTNTTLSGGIAGGTDQYELMSGTSMAAPHIAGLSALTAQYLEESDYAEQNPVLAENYSTRAIIQSLLMSTATPITDGGSYAPILQQGAGLVDVSRAVSAESVIMMDEAGLTTLTGAAADGKVKAELGDDAERTGEWSYSFTIYNITDKDLTFDLSTDIFTQDYYQDGDDLFLDYYTAGLEANVSYSYTDDAQESYDVNLDGVTDANDAQALLDYLSGAEDNPDYDYMAGDADGSGDLTTYDAYLILQVTPAEEGMVVKANSCKHVTVNISLPDHVKEALDEIFTSGAYIEGFTTVECTSETLEGESFAHTHSIPILAFYGDWTDPSMFDNTSYTDTLYDTYKVPYSGKYETNYITLKYGANLSVFTGNPYMVEDTFPTDALAVNSKNAFGNLYYNLVRSAGTTGFAVSRTDELGGNIEEVLNSSVSGQEVDGLWYDEEDQEWQNTGTKQVTIGRTPASYGLAEDDTFRIGFYALPEYTGMLFNSLAYGYDLKNYDAGLLYQSDFENVLMYGFAGKGSYVGFDFTVDDTAPVIDSVDFDGENISISATDNQNLAYIAIISLDGQSVFAETAPHDPEAEITFDASEAVENAKGYVAVFVADYAGNEAAKALKVNDNKVESEKTLYVLTDAPQAGRNYLIVNTDAAGSGYAVGHSGRTITVDDVAINEGIEETGNVVYIDPDDVDETSVWAASKTSAGAYRFKNDTAYLRRTTKENLDAASSTSNSNWTWDGTGSALYYTKDDVTYYVGFNGSTFAIGTDSASVYLFEEQDVTFETEADPYAVESVTVVPGTLDLYRGNETDLSAEVLPLTVEDRSVTWESSDSSVAAVDESGHVIAVGAGSAVITARSAADPSVYAECPVNIIVVDKTLNGIVYDENSEIYFSSFNTSSLPAWNRMHTEPVGAAVLSAFVTDGAELYAGTLDSSSASTELYTVDPSSYELTEYAPNYMWATDIAVGGVDYPEYIGMVYTYGTYVIGGPVEPEDDGSGTLYSGVPYAFSDLGATTGNAYLAGIAVKERTSFGGNYYVLDENGVIWLVSVDINDDYSDFEVSTPTKVADTGISTSFLYQNLYYDGEYLYWAHYADNVSTIYIIDPETGITYDAGTFPDAVWPVSGLYAEGQAAPAVISDAPANLPVDFAPLNISRSSLMSQDIMNRFYAEAAKMGYRSVNLPAAAADAAVYNAAPEEDTASDGGLNSVKNYTGKRADRRHTVREINGYAELAGSEGTAVISLTEDVPVTNGLITVTYPDNLTFAGAGSPLYFSAHDDTESHTVTVAYAAISEVEAGAVLASLTFTGEPLSGTATATVIERNEVAGITGEYTDIIIGGPEFKSHSLLLSGQIGVQFYLDLPGEETAADYPGSYVTFEGNKISETQLALADARTVKGMYEFIVNISSIQMADKFTPAFHYFVDGEERTITGAPYSAEDYIIWGLDNLSGNALAIVGALADYGHYAQPYLSELNGWTIGDAYAEMTTHVTEEYDYDAIKAATADYEIVKGTNDSITKVTFKMQFGSEITLRVTLTPASGVTLDTVLVDGEEVTPKKSGKTYIVDFTGIKASRLTDTHTIVAEGAETIVSPMSYVYGMLASTATSDAAKDLVCALYNFAQVCVIE